MRINKLHNLFFLLLFSSLTYANNAPLPAQLLLNIYQEPSPMKADDKYFLVYEIYLTNFMKDIAKINFFQIDNDNKKSLITLDNIKNSIQPRDIKADKNIFEFSPGETKTVFIWIPFEKITDIPKKLTHHITIDSTFQNKKYSFNMGSYSIRVNKSFPIIVDSPLRGKNWLAGNAPSNMSDHRRTSMILNGKPYYAQRYAIDFVQMGKDGKSYNGDVHKNTSYHCYNQDLLAVANGTVVKIQDGIPENIPNSNQFATPITEKTLPGNYIIIDIGNGKYAGYAHVIPGSFKVKVGDHVSLHQVIAKLGNSGNSSEPHLHFQIINNNSFLESNGIPYGFKHFWAHSSELLNDESGSLKIKISNKNFKQYDNQLVLENALINFD